MNEDTQTWYAARHSGSIAKVDVVKETPTTLIIRDQHGPYQTAKSKQAVSYFKTWSEAHAHLQLIAEAKLKGAKLDLDRARSYLELVKKMKP